MQACCNLRTTEDDPEDSIRGDFDEEMRKRVLAQHQQKQQQQRSPSTSAPEQGGKESADDKRKRQAEKKAQRLKRMGVSKAENAIPEHERALMTESEAKRKESKAKRSRTAKRESEMLDKLKAFEQSLSGALNYTIAILRRVISWKQMMIVVILSKLQRERMRKFQSQARKRNEKAVLASQSTCLKACTTRMRQMATKTGWCTA